MPKFHYYFKSHLMNTEMIQLTPIPRSLVARSVPSTLAAVCSASPAHWTTASIPWGGQIWLCRGAVKSRCVRLQAQTHFQTALYHFCPLFDTMRWLSSSCSFLPLLSPTSDPLRMKEIRHIGICMINCTVWQKMIKTL